MYENLNKNVIVTDKNEGQNYENKNQTVINQKYLFSFVTVVS